MTQTTVTRESGPDDDAGTPKKRRLLIACQTGYRQGHIQVCLRRLDDHL